MTYNINEIRDFYTLIYAMEKKVKDLLYQDSKKHEMDAEPYWVIAAIEDDLLPVIEEVLAKLDDAPSDEEMGYGSEPPLTAAEMHEAAWKQHIALHSWLQPKGGSTSLLLPFSLSSTLCITMAKKKETVQLPLPNYTNKVDYIMKNFDFIKVQQAMIALNWKWMHYEISNPDERLRIPTLDRIRSNARDLLIKVCTQPETLYGTGGFEAERYEEGTIELRFVLTHYNSEYAD